RAGVALVVILLVALVIWRASSGGEYVAPTPSAAPHLEPDTQGAISSLDTLVSRVRSGAQPTGSDAASVAERNAHAVGVTGFTADYVTDASDVAPDGTWSGDVDVTWQMRGEPRLTTDVKVDFGAHGQITGFEAGDGRLPLWLSAPVTVQRTATTTVIVQGDAQLASRYTGLAERAVAGVRKVVAWPHANLILEVPSGGLDAALGAKAGTYKEVAGVTSTIDGSTNPKMPVHIWINPGLIGDLNSPGAQVVLTHEATHYATGAATNTKRPLWLSEGFADYVALHDTTMPLSKTAGQILAQVRKSGAPKSLPSKADFNQQADTFGTEYESAWMACRMLGTGAAGERNLIAVYDDTGRGVSLDASLRKHFGFGEAELTSRWRTYLTDNAKTR
ncbi:MAG: hypothetical protein J2O46_09100, partial [Nocardioides sp.]|nr:hypothetical protein [Nocardioides sp.]